MSINKICLENSKLNDLIKFSSTYKRGILIFNKKEKEKYNLVLLDHKGLYSQLNNIFASSNTVIISVTQIVISILNSIKTLTVLKMLKVITYLMHFLQISHNTPLSIRVKLEILDLEITWLVQKLWRYKVGASANILILHKGGDRTGRVYYKVDTLSSFLSYCFKGSWYLWKE